MKLLVLSRNPRIYSTNRLVLAARARGHEVVVADPLDLQLVVKTGRPQMLLRGTPVEHVDIVIPRIGASITNAGLAALRQFEAMQIPVMNSSEAIAASRDKLRALQLLVAQGLQIPVTVVARQPEGLKAAVDSVGGFPAIVKLQQGTQGIGTMIAESQQSLASLLETLWAMGQNIILQEYIRESKGRDLRVIIVGGKIVATMERVAKKGEFRANLHRGATARTIKLSRAYQQAALRAAAAVGLDVAGVDLLMSKRGPQVLEINSSPGLEGIERTTRIDVATAIVKHAENLVAANALVESKRRLGRSAKRSATRKPTAGRRSIVGGGTAATSRSSAHRNGPESGEAAVVAASHKITKEIRRRVASQRNSDALDLMPLVGSGASVLVRDSVVRELARQVS